MVILYYSRNILFSKHIYFSCIHWITFCMCLVLDTVVKIEGKKTLLILKLKSIVLRTRLIHTYMNNFFWSNYKSISQENSVKKSPQKILCCIFGTNTRVKKILLFDFQSYIEGVYSSSVWPPPPKKKKKKKKSQLVDQKVEIQFESSASTLPNKMAHWKWYYFSRSGQRWDLHC